jgi:hypothetical protein
MAPLIGDVVVARRPGVSPRRGTVTQVDDTTYTVVWPGGWGTYPHAEVTTDRTFRRHTN